MSPSIEDFENSVKKLLLLVQETVIAKHKDYGQSGLQKPILAPHVSTLDALLVRQSDKYSRLLNLMQKQRQEVNESLHDTVLDILGYDVLIALEVGRLAREGAL